MKKTMFRLIYFALPLLLSFGVFANEGLNLDLAIHKINKDVKALNNETNEQVIETDYKSITQKKKEILR